MNPLEWLIYGAAWRIWRPLATLSTYTPTEVEEAARQVAATGLIIEGSNAWADRLHPSLWCRILEIET